MGTRDPTPRNPYAPSRASLAARAGAAAVTGATVWRDGNTVVTLRDASLPPRCVKCNRPADQPTRQRTMYWVHPAVYLLFLAGPILLIAYLIARKRADVNPGQCGRHRKRRLIAIAGGWLGFFGGLGLLATGLADGSPARTLLGLSSMLAAIAMGLTWGRLVWVKKITADEVRLGGFSAEYLDELPDYD